MRRCPDDFIFTTPASGLLCLKAVLVHSRRGSPLPCPLAGHRPSIFSFSSANALT